MVNLLNPMLMGPAQALQQPPAMPAPLAAPSRFAGAGQRLRGMLAPEIALPMAGAMMMGRTPGESFGNAMMIGGQAMGEQKMKEEEQRQQNATLAYLQKSRPDLAAAVSAGMPMQMAWQHAFNKGSDLTDDMREYQMAADQGFGGSFMDYMTTMRKAGATTVNVGDGAPGLGKLSADYGYVLDPATRQPVIDPKTGLPKAAPVPGSPAAQENQQRVRAQTSTMQSYEQKYNLVDSAIDDVLDSTSGWTAGPGGALLSNVPGTPAYDMARTIETIKANLGFEELQAMRDNSPTGGALGQVTERELAFLQAAQGNLDQAQTPEQLKKVLRDIQLRRREFREARRKAYEIDYGVSAPDMGGGQMSLDQLLEMYGD